MTKRSGKSSYEALRRQLLTIPNLVTALRLGCLPVFCWLLLGREDLLAAGLLLGALGATDWVDGFLARKLKQATEFGAVFDPVTDRLLFFVSVTASAVGGYIPIWFCVLVLLRECLVSAGTLYLAARKVTWLGVNKYGRAGSFGLMFRRAASVAGGFRHCGCKVDRMGGLGDRSAFPGGGVVRGLPVLGSGSCGLEIAGFGLVRLYARLTARGLLAAFKECSTGYSAGSVDFVEIVLGADMYFGEEECLALFEVSGLSVSARSRRSRS